ncbi:MAG: HAMP domain-containing protein [Bryobacteraceae bacterium]|nr:HAMP domain-containing protein [Bryobacteraceae bacterium]
MNRIRTRLLLFFLAATLVPLAVTLTLTWRLLEHSISLNPSLDLDATSRALEQTGRALYQTTCEALKAEVDSGRRHPAQIFRSADRANWPDEALEFAESPDRTLFHLAGESRNRVEYYVRDGDNVRLYSRPIEGPGMKAVTDQYLRARARVERSSVASLRRGYTLTLIVLAAAVWIVAFTAVFYIARRVSRPLEQLTSGLQRLAGGDLNARLEARGTDEVADAMRAFNHTAEQLRDGQDKLIHVTRLASWQSLARKMAHEVKNSLTPIRLTVEEIVARRSSRDEAFFEQAAQIVVEEVSTLERRVRAFTEFASEPPVQLDDVDVNVILEERLALLRAAHPEVSCDAQFTAEPLTAHVDPDLLKGVFTNLLDNAAHAAGKGGRIRGKTFALNNRVGIEIHDSGPGLSTQALESLFEPTISFKKAGMGLGLSIAKRSALLVGGDILLVDGELGGAAFRILLPKAEEHAHTASARGG